MAQGLHYIIAGGWLTEEDEMFAELITVITVVFVMCLVLHTIVVKLAFNRWI